jgi:beta-fructofuranosidase
MSLPRRTALKLCAAGTAAKLLPHLAAAPVTLEQIAADTSRPQLHLVAPAHRLNDPNGPVYFNGQHHMFYQKGCPDGKHWGHAASPDMIRWKHLPDAIAPTKGGPDSVNCASGCCVIDNGTPTIIYTGFRPEVQCIATSDKDMLVWRKFEGNPVIPGPPNGHYVMPKSSSAAPDSMPDDPRAIALTGFRDPHVWKQGADWMMIVGSGFHRRGGAPLLYRSRDLRKWEYLHPLCTGFRDVMAWGSRPHDTGEVWECPDFFPLGDKHVLIVSTMLRTQYFVGRYENLRFYPEAGGCCDFGHYYAGTSQAGARGERILWGWVREIEPRLGWGAAISLPRKLTLGSDGTMRYAFAAEVNSLREAAIPVQPGPIEPGHPQLLPQISADMLDIFAEVMPGNAEQCGLSVCRTADGMEETRILYQPQQRTLIVDLTKSSLAPARTSPSIPRDAARVLHAPLELPAGEPLRLRVVIDASVIEIIANERTCLTVRSYPSRPDALNVALVAIGGTARLNRLDGYKLRPISRDRLTT